MDKLLEKLLEIILSGSKSPTIPWVIALILFIYIIRTRIEKLIDKFLDKLEKIIGGKWSYRRFDLRFRQYIRERHLYLKLVGIRTEEERQPHIIDAYVPIKLVPKGGKIDSSVYIKQIVDANNFALILGDPGAGKSTLLFHLITEFTDPLPKRRLKPVISIITRLFLRKRTRLLPVYIPLRSCRKQNKMLLDDLLDPTTDNLTAAMTYYTPKNFFHTCLSKGKALVLLDGLDEVADSDAYQSVVKKVNEFIQLYPKNKVIATCRKAGWRGGLNPDCIYITLPLDSQQQHDFIHKWYLAILKYASYGLIGTEEDFKKRAMSEANRLVNLLRAKERLREISNNPLILSLICLVHRQRKNLPRGRAELYEDCIEILLDLWDRIDKDLEQEFPTTGQKKKLLRRIAFHMHNIGIKEIDRHELEVLSLEFLPEIKDRKTSAELVRQIEVRSGLMMERSIDKLAFSHLTFQEFFVVEYFRSEPDISLDVDVIEDWSKWREPLLLMCGIETNPKPLIEKLYQIQPLLAIYGICEVDPSVLDKEFYTQFIDITIDKITLNKIDINDAIPPLVELLSIEGNPFEAKIKQFIFNFIGGIKSSDKSSVEKINNLIESLSKIPTRGAAKIILYIMTNIKIENMENVFITGLARIGDQAIYESLDWITNTELNQDFLLKLLIECRTTFATETLWKEYEFCSSKVNEYDWAKAWALHLSNRENDKIIRQISNSEDTHIKDEFWPYKNSRNSIISSIICKTCHILCSHYKSIWDVFKEIELISQFSLRVQIPLLVHFFEKSDTVGDTKDKEKELKKNEQELIKYWEKTTAEKVLKNRDLPIESVGTQNDLIKTNLSDKKKRIEIISRKLHTSLFLPESSSASNVKAVFKDSLKKNLERLFRTFNKHSWLTLGGYLTRKDDTQRKILQNLVFTIGLIMELISVFVLIYCIRSLLPPDGTYSGFQGWLPQWAKITIGITYFLIFGLILLFVSELAEDGVNAEGGGVGCAFLLIIVILFFVFSPTHIFFVLIPLILFSPVMILSTESIEKMISLRKIRRGMVSYVLLVGTISGIVGFFTLNKFFGQKIAHILYAQFIFIFTLLGFYFQGRAKAFQKNEIYLWLQGHPRGKEVLDEYLLVEEQEEQ